MKRNIAFIFFYVVFTSGFGQNGKKFEYQTGQFGNLIVTPAFDKSKGEGKPGIANFSDQNYMNGLVYGVIKDVLSKEKLLKMHLNSGYIIYFNQNGEIINITFNLNPEDIDLFTQEDFYNLYSKFKNTKIDMNKVSITGGNDVPPGETYDYARLVGSIVPFEYRNDPRLKK